MQCSDNSNDTKLYVCDYIGYKNTKNTNLKFNLNKLIIDRIIKLILTDFCNIAVLGYDTHENKYWCKKYNTNYCILYLKLSVYDKGVNYSEIVIEPIMYSKSELDIFITDFSASIHMYKTSNFIKRIIDTKYI